MATTPQNNRHRAQSERSTLHSAFHAGANFAAAKFMRMLFGYSCRIHALGLDNVKRPGGFLLAANHISHFDPLIISGVVSRKIDWMAMAEFFPKPVVGQFLRAVDAFPAARDRADRATIRSAIERLKSGRIVGLFPEGGIRDGAASVLQGAPMRAGVAALADIASVPVVPCVIIGSDRLYCARRWKPLRRTPVWIAFGEPISPNAAGDKSLRRAQIEKSFADAIAALALELQSRFGLTADDFPRPPRERMAESLQPTQSTC